MTATSRPRRASKDVQSHLLGTALRGLGLALGTSATPRLEFQRDLRERLIEEARLLAVQTRPPPRGRRPRRPRGGGIRLAAIGIGFSLAGGGVVAAAHSLSLPPATAAPAVDRSPGSSLSNGSGRARSPRAVTAATGPAYRPLTPALARPSPPASVRPPASPAPLLAGLPVDVPTGAVVPALTVPTPSAPATLQAPEISVTISPEFKQPFRSAAPPTIVPSWRLPESDVSPTPWALNSPLR